MSNIRPQTLAKWGFFSFSLSGRIMSITGDFYSGNSLPGFKIPFESNVFLMAFIKFNCTWVNAMGMYSFWTSPIPCSPLNVPPRATHNSKILLMALQAQLNDESFIHFVTQKTNLGEKLINLSLRQFANFFCFFCSWCKAFFCSWCRHFFVRGARLP